MKSYLSVCVVVLLGIGIGYGSALYCKANASPLIIDLGTNHSIRHSTDASLGRESFDKKSSSAKVTIVETRAKALETRPKVEMIAISPKTGNGLESTSSAPVPQVGKFIDVSIEEEHLWRYQDGKLIDDWLISASFGPIIPCDAPATEHEKAHNHLGSFTIFRKEPVYRSIAYDVVRHNWLFFIGGHAFHSCAASDIGLLGTKVSHGCVRSRPDNAQKLFDWADIGTRVRIRK